MKAGGDKRATVATQEPPEASVPRQAQLVLFLWVRRGGSPDGGNKTIYSARNCLITGGSRRRRR